MSFAGIVEPIKAGIRDPKLGVGKQEQDDFFTSEENVQRKKLDVEVEETEERAKKREVCLPTFKCSNISCEMLCGRCKVLKIETHISNSRRLHIACICAFLTGVIYHKGSMNLGGF